MEKFNRTLRGYDPDEVNAFLDQVIGQVERMISDIKDKNARIAELESVNQENTSLHEKLNQYERMEETLSKAIVMAQKTSDQMRASALQESEIIVENAKGNANRIVNEALLKAEKTEDEAHMLRRNINIFKRRLKETIQEQLEVIDSIERINL